MAREVIAREGIEVPENKLPELVPALADSYMPDDEVVYIIRLIKPGESTAIRRRIVRQAFDPKSRRLVDRDATPDEEEQIRAELLAAIVQDWRGVMEGGAALPCTPDNIRRVLVDLYAGIGASLIQVATTGNVKTREDVEASFRGTAGVAAVVD